jgi:hypothetical protein
MEHFLVPTEGNPKIASVENVTLARVEAYQAFLVG